MTRNAPLTVSLDRRLIRPRWHSKRFVVARVTAPEATRRTERAPVNLAFVLDRSGSMGGQKLRLAAQAVEEAIGRLHASDRFSIVIYDDIVETLVHATDATSQARDHAIGLLGRVEARGSTDLSGGWLTGCEQVAQALLEDGVNRCLLLTDGLANRGITDRHELARHAGELRARGVSTSTFGVGNDFDEALLQAMADAGGGHFYYIANAGQIRDHIASEVGETLEVVARDAELEVLAGEGIEVESISPHPLTSRGTRSLVALGDLVADQVLDVVLRLTFPYGQLGRESGLIIAVRDRDGAFLAAGVRDARLTWTWADDRTNDAQDRDVDVDRAVARQFAARARQEAVMRNKQGDFGQARWVLEATAKRIRRYAGRDADMRALVAELEAETPRFSAAMPAMMLKEAHFRSANAARSRDIQGRSLKSR